MSFDDTSRPLSVFNHLSAPSAALYRRVLGVFVDAKERFQVHLRPDDVLAAMRERDAAIEVQKAAAPRRVCGRGDCWRGFYGRG